MNLVKLFLSIDESAKAEGLAWYATAHKFCVQVSVKYEVPLNKVCAIMSALSPATNYEQNKKDTENFIRLQKGIINAYKCTTYGQNVAKAKSIFESDSDPLTFFSVKTGPKTYNFYLNVLDPKGETAVTIDRHAYAIATGKEYKGLAKAQYEKIARQYTLAAKKLGLLPLELQAILWVDYRIKEVNKFKAYDFEAGF
jgi:hypothetical protein